jgi:hypothetical protein
MRIKKTGFYFVEGMPHGGEEPWDGRSGKNSVGWTPYKIWVGDLFECPDCHNQTISGVGHQRIAEHYEPGFKMALVNLNALQLLVKDC